MLAKDPVLRPKILHERERDGKNVGNGYQDVCNLCPERFAHNVEGREHRNDVAKRGDPEHHVERRQCSECGHVVLDVDRQCGSPLKRERERERESSSFMTCIVRKKAMNNKNAPTSKFSSYSSAP